MRKVSTLTESTIYKTIVRVPSRSETNERGKVVEKKKFPQKAMLWLGECSKGISSLVIFGEHTFDHAQYITKAHLNMEVKSLVTIRPFSKMEWHHISINQLNNGARIIFHHSSTKIAARLIAPISIY